MSAHHLTLTGSVSAGSGQATGRRRSARYLMVLPLIWLVRAYQLVVSPMRPPCCRFYPSCSAYALTALERFGLVRGGWLALRRLRHCHPWNPGGVDHVPPAEPPDHQHHH